MPKCPMKSKDLREIADLASFNYLQLKTRRRLHALAKWLAAQEEAPKVPHASDCAHWVDEPCDCITGKDI